MDGLKEGVERKDGALIFHYIVVGGVENGGVRRVGSHGSLAVSEGNHHRYAGTGVGTAEEVVEFPAIGRGFESGAVFFDHLVDAFSRGEAEKFFFVVGATHSTEGGEGDDEGMKDAHGKFLLEVLEIEMTHVVAAAENGGAQPIKVDVP